MAVGGLCGPRVLKKSRFRHCAGVFDIGLSPAWDSGRFGMFVLK